MDNIYKKGDICYFIVSNVEVVEGTIVSSRLGQYIIKYNNNAIISLSQHRLFSSYAAACQHIENIKKAQGFGFRRHKTPYDYDH